MTYVDEQKLLCEGEYHTKKVATKLIKLFLIYILAIIFLHNGIEKYSAKDNWKSTTIMTEMMKFETTMHPIKELYMIKEFNIGILILLESLVITVLFAREIKCEIAITNKGIHGVTYWRKKIYIPNKSIQSVYIKKNRSCICVETNLRTYNFAYVENYMDIYEILSGNLKIENSVLFSQIEDKEKKSPSGSRKIWIRLLVAAIIILASVFFVKSN